MKTDRAAGSIPGTQIALVGVQLGLAAMAAALDLAEACQACVRGGSLHLAIALGGVIGYGGLLALGLGKKQALFTLGVFAAAGIHGALGAELLLERKACPPCVAALGVAIALGVRELRSRGACLSSALGTLSGAAATLLALGPSLAWAADRPAPSGTVAPIVVPRPASRSRTLHLDVYEAAHCSYCADFRAEYLPRLEREFQGGLEVRFQDAAQFGWVQRTPTFVLEGRLLFEGLPWRYEDLAEEIRFPAPPDRHP
jgi:hypothetical protein